MVVKAKRKKKYTVTLSQYLRCQRKAFKIWQSLVKDVDSSYWLEVGAYIAHCKNTEFEPYYVVSTFNNMHNINTATGMFRFIDDATAKKFLKLMGEDIKNLFPEIIHP